jgi:hypothetical protein
MLNLNIQIFVYPKQIKNYNILEYLKLIKYNLLY